MATTLGKDHYEPDPLVQLVTRQEWEAKPANTSSDVKAPLRPYENPITYVRFTSTLTGDCSALDTCSALMRDLQEKHITNDGLADVRFNFVVGADGRVYEGRGWNYDSDRTSEFDKVKGKCVDIAYVGDYRIEGNPRWEALKAGFDILKYGLKFKHINASFEVIPYRDDTLKKEI